MMVFLISERRTIIKQTGRTIRVVMLEKMVFEFQTSSDTNWPVQSHKKSSCLKFWM